jgi:hypothetical protein
LGGGWLASKFVVTLSMARNFVLLLDKGAMLFQKLIEQHRVDVLVAHAVGFSFFVHSIKAGLIFATSSAIKAKLRRVGGVPLVVECHWI